MDISFLIATIRPHANYLNPLIDSVRSLSNLQRYSYEIVVCSSQEVGGNDVKWIQEEKQEGSVKAYNNTYKASSGRVIVGLSDGILLSPDCLLTIDHVESLAGRFQLTSLREGSSCDLPFCEIDGNIMRWPVVTRATVENELSGVLFNESFIYHYCDCWLGAYPSLLGEPVYDCPNRSCHIINIPHRADCSQDKYDESVMKSLLGSSGLQGYNMRFNGE